MTKRTDIEHVQDIYDRDPNGILGIAIRLKRHPRTIERWLHHGIPDTYWDFLHKTYGITPFELFRLNAKLRGYRA